MNIVAPSTTVRKPQTFAVGATIPYMWGAQDAAAGLACVPEMQWVRRTDQVEYAAGYASVAGDTYVTRQFLGGPAPVTAADIEATIDAIFAPVVVDDSESALDLFDYEAEADEYEEDMLDREYHARGGW